MDRATLDAWMQGYQRAWGSNDPEDIGALFTDDARYYTAPYREPWSGREGIVHGWIDRKDEPGEWEFEWEPVLLHDDLAIIRGVTHYTDDPTDPTDFSNLWLIRLTPDGRCSEFTEWWMQHDPPQPDS